jgi:glucose-1-phosphate adenylyltransferase
MRRTDTVLPIMLAGGQGSRLYELTERECKPAVPFTGGRRIVDWTLGNVVASEIRRIAVATQFCPSTLEYHLRNAWGPAFAPFGLQIYRGPNLTGRPHGYLGTADAVAKILPQAARARDREILVLSADHIYDMDYRPMIEAHRATGAAVTVGAVKVARAEAHAFGVIAANAEGQIATFHEKPHDPAPMPDDPASALVSMGIYVFDRTWLEATLREDALNPTSQHDFGHDILPLAVAAGVAAVFVPQPASGRFYWRDVGTLDSYRAAALDFADGTATCALPPSRGAFAPLSSFVRGDSVVLPGAFVEAGSRLHRTIVAPNTLLPADLVIGQDDKEDARWFRIAPGGTRLVTSAMMARRAEALGLAPLRPTSHFLRQRA